MKEHLLGLYTSIYLVEDITRARNWYVALLGKDPYFDQPFYVGFNVSGCELGLMPSADAARKEKGCVAYWGVADIEAAQARLEAAGHSLFEPVREVGDGIKVASFLDADENIVGLIENPHYPDTVNP